MLHNVNVSLQQFTGTSLLKLFCTSAVFIDSILHSRCTLHFYQNQTFIPDRLFVFVLILRASSRDAPFSSGIREVASYLVFCAINVTGNIFARVVCGARAPVTPPKDVMLFGKKRSLLFNSPLKAEEENAALTCRDLSCIGNPIKCLD